MNEVAVVEKEDQSVALVEGAIHGMPSAQELMVYQTWAKTAAESKMYKGVGTESGIMMIMLAAREYGIGPAQALNGGLHIIEGKVELSARMMSALIRRAKHSVRIIESTDRICTLHGKRRDNGDEFTASFTIEEAQQAGLIKDKGAWKKTPKDMLFARAMTRLARQLFADVVGIGYVEGEISGDDPEDLPEVQPINELQLEHVPEVKQAEESALLAELMEKLDKDDCHYMNEFIKIVSDHYGWDKHATLKKFLADVDQTLEKFHKWKNTRKDA